MIRDVLSVLIILAMIVFAGKWMLSNIPDHESHDNAEREEAMDEEFTRGPHRGRLLSDGDFAIEITIFETGVPPEFHVYAYEQGNAIDPASLALSIQLSRLGGDVDDFMFIPQADHLRGDGVVTEPHSFDVTVKAEHKGKNYQWSYENYEGRTQIPVNVAEVSGVKTENAGSTIITDYLSLNGKVQINPNKQ